MLLKMRKKLVDFLITIFLSLAPILAWSAQLQTKISADTINVQGGELLIATGNVIIQHGKNAVKANALTFDKKTNEIRFEDLKEFYDGNAIRISAEEAILNSTLSSGVIYAARILLNETLKIKAEQIELQNNQVFSASGISQVTSCEECPGKPPNWYLTASSAKRDTENLDIVYRNVTVRARGFPIAYLPYLRMPDPSVDRANGFLVPEAVLTSNLATGLKIPYFIPMGLSRDILITPYFSSKTKTLEYRYRQKFNQGELAFTGAFSNDELKKNELRYFSRAIGSFDLGYGVDLNFDIGKVRDNSYLGDYVYFEDSDLNSEISLEKTIVENRRFFDGSINYLKENKPGSSLDKYFSLSGSYITDISSHPLPGNLNLITNLNSSFNVKDDNSVSRPPSSAQVEISYNQVNTLSAVQIKNNIFSNLSSFVNSTNTGNTNEEFALKYGYSALISAPYKKRRINGLSIFNPKISVAYNGQENDISGKFFISPEELSWGNLYSGKKITSLTESEKGISASFGFEHKILWDTGQQVEISLAASKIGGLTYDPNSNLGLVNKKLNYIGKFSYYGTNLPSFTSNVLLASRGSVLQGEIKGKYNYKNIKLHGKYEYIDQTIDNRLTENLKTFDFKTSYKFIDSLAVNSGGRFDLGMDKMAETFVGLGLSIGPWQYHLKQEFLKEEREKLFLSAIYDDNCTRVTFSFENRYQELGSSKPVEYLTLRVQFKSLANVVFSQASDQFSFLDG